MITIVLIFVWVTHTVVQSMSTLDFPPTTFIDQLFELWKHDVSIVADVDASFELNLK